MTSPDHLRRIEQAALEWDLLVARLRAAETRIVELEAALVEACDLASEGWDYAGDYFREKWRADERVERLRKIGKPRAASGSPAKRLP